MTEPGTISIVEDDVSLRESLKSLLRAAGFRVHDFSSAEECIRSFSETRPDCLITDIRLPGISGVEMCRMMRDQGERTPIVIISGTPKFTDTHKLLDDCTIYLAKPLDLPVLFEWLFELVDRNPNDCT